MVLAGTATDASSYVIIGNGIAGITAAEILRKDILPYKRAIDSQVDLSPIASHLKQAASTSQPILTTDGSLRLPGATEVLPADVVATLRQSPALIVMKAGKPEVFYLQVPGEAGTPQGKKQLTIGRDRKNDIMLADVAVSRHHAELFPGPNGFYIRDLKSSNGVLINQTKIAKPYQLTHGDRIVIGSSVCYFVQLQTLQSQLPMAISTLSKTCSTCGVTLENATARFCPRCGSPLGQAQSEVR